jgi:hypothetical protein
MYNAFISEKYYGKFFSYKNYVFAARGTSLNEHLIPGGTEIKFKINNLPYPGRAENYQLKA